MYFIFFTFLVLKKSKENVLFLTRTVVLPDLKLLVRTLFVFVFSVFLYFSSFAAGHFENRKQSCDLNRWILGYLASLEMATF